MDRDDLSYEQIVVDHPEEFSPRALWFSRRTLGLANESERAPAQPSIPVQIRTEELLKWLSNRPAANGGQIPSFANAEAAAALGMTGMARHGRVFGTIQSRLDFACYRLKLPPLGLRQQSRLPRLGDRKIDHGRFLKGNATRRAIIRVEATYI